MKEYKPVKSASKYEKIQMSQMAIDETVCSKELFHPVFEDDCPYEYKVTNHRGYQLDAYRTDNGEIADSSYHLLIVRCGVCKELMTVDGSDFTFCFSCETDYS